MTLQLSSAASVLGSVVRRTLRVMFTTTTLDDIAIDRPTIAEPAGLMPNSAHTTAATPQVMNTWAGASTSSRLWRARWIGLISMPTSNSRSTTPMSASTASCSRLAVYPGVNGETSRPTAR